MMRTIYFFHPSSELYGADKILIYIIRNFRDYKKVLFLPEKGSLYDLIIDEFSDIDIVILKNYPFIAKKNFTLKGIFYFLYSLIKFRFDIDLNKADIIYLNTLAVCPISMFRSSNRKTILHVHEILSNKSFIQKHINKIALRNSDLIIAVSEAVRTNLLESKSNHINQIVTIHNGISFKTISDKTNNGLITDKSRINFGLIGRLKPSHKGQILLIEAINKLSDKELENSHFYFVGSTVSGQEYMLNDIMKKINGYNLNKIITIIPFVKDIETIYKSLDVVVVPSVFDDPFPTTVLEGMFFSKPVLGTRVGGIPEMIEDNITGMISDKNDFHSLSKNIKYLIENPDMIKKMGEKGKEKFEKHFTESSFNNRFSSYINVFLPE